MNPEENPGMIKAANDLASEFRALRTRLEAAEKNEQGNRESARKSRRTVHWLTGVIAGLAFAVSLAVGWVAWQHSIRIAQEARQDRQARQVQQENAAFRRRLCGAVQDWQIYLREAPAGSPAGRAAAARLAASLDSACQEPVRASRFPVLAG